MNFRFKNPYGFVHELESINGHGYYFLGFSKKMAMAKDTRLKKFDSNKDSEKSGVETGAIYLYYGISSKEYTDVVHARPYNLEMDDIYVGMAFEQSWLDRVGQSHKDKDERIDTWRENNWRYTFVFTPVDEGRWDKYDTEYLEYMFYCVAEVAGNFNLINNISPSVGDPADISSDRKLELNQVLVKAADWMRDLDYPILRI